MSSNHQFQKLHPEAREFILRLLAQAVLRSQNKEETIRVQSLTTFTK